MAHFFETQEQQQEAKDALFDARWHIDTLIHRLETLGKDCASDKRRLAKIIATTEAAEARRFGRTIAEMIDERKAVKAIDKVRAGEFGNLPLASIATDDLPRLFDEINALGGIEDTPFSLTIGAELARIEAEMSARAPIHFPQAAE